MRRETFAGQISLFDWMPSSTPEPNIGDYVKRPGAIICHIMRPGYIGRKILVDVSTEHNELYQCGILENYIPYESFMRSIVYVGDRQRKLITHYPGVEIFECLPWDYEKRVKP